MERETLDQADVEQVETARENIDSVTSATEHLNEIVHRYGSNTPAYILNAKADLEAGNPEEAKQNLNRVIEAYA